MLTILPPGQVTARDEAGDTRCLNSIVNIIPSGNLVSSLADGSTYALTVSCTPPCTGSGLDATFTVTSGVVTTTTLVASGCGYDPSFPPTISSASQDATAFTPTFTGQLQAFAAVSRVGTRVGGLAATYYDGNDLTRPVKSVTEAVTPDFSHACSRGGPEGCPGPVTSLASGEGFAVRWAGHVQV